MTPDEQPFLATLAADPADDVCRLVYADWLDEHDQPARAAYLRHVAAVAASLAEGEAEGVPAFAGAAEVPADWRLAAGGRFGLVLTGFEARHKIGVIKVVRELTGMGLADTKGFVESLPAVVCESTTLEHATAVRDHIRQFDSTRLAFRPAVGRRSVLPQRYQLTAYTKLR